MSRPSRIFVPAMILWAFSAGGTLDAATIVKANNTTSLSVGTSWVGGVAPGSTAVAQWNSTVTGSNATTLGGSLNVGEISILNPGGPVTINADGNTLGLTGISGTGIDMSSATQNLTLDCPVALGSSQTWNADNPVVGLGGSQTGASQALTVAGNISGGFGLTVTGNLLFLGANTYTGGTTVNNGVLEIDSDAQLGSVPTGPITNITLNGGQLYNNGTTGIDMVTLATNRTIYLGASGGYFRPGWPPNVPSGFTVNGQITGPGGLGVDWDSGFLILNGPNNYQGATTIGTTAANSYFISTEANPTLQLGNNNALPGSDLIFGSSANNNSATLDMHGFSATVRALSGGTNAIVDIVSSGGTSNLTVGNNNASSTFGGVIRNTTGGLSLTKIGSGTMTLTGANTYTGATTVQGGLLVLQGNSQSSSFTTASGGTLQIAGNTPNLFYGSVTAQTGGAVEYNSATINGGYLRGPGTHATLPGGTSTFNGVTSYASTNFQQNGPTTFTSFTNAGRLANNAPLTWDGGFNTSGGSLTVNNTVTVDNWENDGVVTVNSGGALNNCVNNLTSGGGSRIAVNPGGLLNANGDGSGSALDLNGALLVNNGTVTGTTNVYFGSLAQGSGTYGTVNVYNGGAFRPGNSPGAVTTGSVTWNSGGQYLMEINDATGTAGTNWNLWNINGSLALYAGTTPNSRFTLVLESGSDEDPGLAANFDDTNDYQWLIAQTSGGVSGFNAAEISIDTSAFANNVGGGRFSVSQQGDQVFLNYVVPEPGTLVLLGAAALGLIGHLARRWVVPKQR